MKYEAPSVKNVEVSVVVNTVSSELTSCAGGHCVKSRYQADP